MLLPDLIPGLIAASIPSPSQGVWELGPVPIRAYALCIITGIIVAIWLGERRWVARGGQPGEVQDLALWAIPFGLVGARAYHVATDWQQYFGEGGDPVAALYVWRGGLGIWGGVALGALGVYLGARQKGIRISAVLDALAPGVLLAQAIGRWGNWFNQELYGSPTDLPWALEIDQENFSGSYVDQLAASGQPIPEVATFHPTFLYESLWNLAAFVVVLWLERRYRLGYGRVVAAYVMAYTAGRAWIEHVRIDDVQLDDVLGLRWNVWMSIALFLLAAAYWWWSARRHPGQPESVYVDGRGPVETVADGSAEPADDTDVTEATQERSEE
ncbi:prolipoprotein diacylglyceryl transferase [Nocardioides panacisoli]|uniref:prolipoprotein diacylglyceryl transferase n=1 Tax=Nocardioides panacisoli TaxID=627624 RepID=UPI001C62EB43|nr:prolipoprotein diacylglyceryl transferase [Nocardioides panacisoli]QYJ04771.1 prolipoprotein diacylglyceryl transferase [Nocardioides panacisoli]